jgi:ABC-type Fe3+/spermidine/putrescine transport system ATPase subunit
MLCIFDGDRKNLCMSKKALLSIEHVSISYNAASEPAIQNVSFQVKAGESVAIIGESGSGKSTLMRAIACMQACDEGAIYLNGQLMPNPKDLLVRGHEDIRYVSQDTILPKSRSVVDMLKYELRYFDSNEQAILIDQYLDIFSLQEFRDRKDVQLSGGQKQRVALALAMASDADLLVLDEPFNQVDVITREKIKEQLFHYFRSSGKTLIMVTHDAVDALPWSDHIVVLRDGKLIQKGTPQAVYEKPNEMYIASLFGPVQLLNKKQLKTLLNIDWPSRCKYAGIRYADIVYQLKPIKDAIKVTWQKSYYAGSQYKWLLKDETGEDWMVYAKEEQPNVKHVYISFPLSKLFFFK